jgi:hypothetical protein
VYGAVAQPTTAISLECPDDARRLEPGTAGTFLAVETDPRLADCTLTVAAEGAQPRRFRLDE